MLSGDNSILQRTTTAKQTSERAEAKEQAQMDIMAYIADKTANHQDVSLDDTKIQEILNDNKSYVKEAKDTSFITTKGEYEIPYSELYNATESQPKDPVITGVNYGSKTAQTVAEGDDITIGTEKFKVLKNDESTIIAIPYYNITLTDEPIQSPTAGTTTFSTSPYWNSQGDVDMTDSNNNIQQYITAYQTTLIKLGATNITTRVVRDADMFMDNMTNQKRNPSQTGSFWVATNFGYPSEAYYHTVESVDSTGNCLEGFAYNISIGVRPLLIITIN